MQVTCRVTITAGRLAQHRLVCPLTAQVGFAGQRSGKGSARTSSAATATIGKARWTKLVLPLAQTSVPALPSLVSAGSTIRLPFHEESRAYIGVVQDGVVRWFGKTTLVGYQVLDGLVEMVLPAKVAAKRGLA